MRDLDALPTSSVTHRAQRIPGPAERALTDGRQSLFAEQASRGAAPSGALPGRVRSGAAPAAQNMLVLQRLYGNRYVQRLLREQGHHSDGPAEQSPAAIHPFGEHIASGTGHHASSAGIDRRVLDHQPARVGWQGDETSQLRRQPAVPAHSPVATPPAPSPGTRPTHSLLVRIKIKDERVIVEDNRGSRKFAGLFSSMPRALSNRLIDEVKGRLSFLGDEGFHVSVEFGEFPKADLKLAGNIQVFLVDELQESVEPGEIMKKLYGYGEASAQSANEEFTNIHQEGPGRERKYVAGAVPPLLDDTVAGTSRPVFVKIPQMFSRDEARLYKEGNKQPAELGVDQIALTTSHELGHIFHSEPNAGHSRGNFNDSKQTFPPDVMDTTSPDAGYTNAPGGGDTPRSSTDANDTLDKEDIEKLGGWSHIWPNVVLPNIGPDKIIRRAVITPEGGLQLWYNLPKLDYTHDEKESMVAFLKGIEMTEAAKRRNHHR